MAIPTSTWDQAIAAIIAAVNLQPAVTASPVLVIEGEPGIYQPDDIISVGFGGISQTVTQMTMVGSGGAHWLYEKYTINIRVEVFRGGDDGPGTRARCKALTDAVDVAVRNDPSLGGVVLVAYPSRHNFSAVEWEVDRKGRVVSCQMSIDCEAQL